MNEFLFKQLEFARSLTLKALEGVTEADATRIPDHFRNHILWNAGHTYLVQERFAFVLHGLDAQLPESYMTLFAPGTTPLNWTETPPTLTEVIDMLQKQPQRIENALKNKLWDQIDNPYTTSTGLTLDSIGSFLNFTFFHEGMHLNTIKNYKVLLNS